MKTLKDDKIPPNVPICNGCKNHIGGLKCKAFQIIPDEIIFGKNNHDSVMINQQNDIVFEPIEKKPTK